MSLGNLREIKDCLRFVFPGKYGLVATLREINFFLRKPTNSSGYGADIR